MILKNCGLVLNANDSRSTFLSETKAATGRFFLVKPASLPLSPQQHRGMTRSLSVVSLPLYVYLLAEFFQPVTFFDSMARRLRGLIHRMT